MAYNANGGSGTTSSHTSPQYYNSKEADTITGVTFTTAANGFTAPTGYHFSKWANDSANGTQVSAGGNAAEFKPDVDKSTAAELTKTMYAIWEGNEISFANQTITKTFSTSQQTQSITDAMKPTNGTGTYTYSKVSGNSNITVASNGTITIAASTTANTSGYAIVIRATDSNSLKTDDATYTIVINKATGSVNSASVSGTAKVGQTLTASGTKTGDGALVYSWYRTSSSTATSGTAIGSNSTTYTCVAADVGYYIRCKITLEAGTNYTGDDAGIMSVATSKVQETVYSYSFTLNGFATLGSSSNKIANIWFYADDIGINKANNFLETMSGNKNLTSNSHINHGSYYIINSFSSGYISTAREQTTAYAELL